MIKSKAVYPQASLECSECNEEVYTCEDCGSYLEEGEIYCGEDYNIHYCKTCGDGLEYRRKEKEENKWIENQEKINEDEHGIKQ